MTYQISNLGIKMLSKMHLNISTEAFCYMHRLSTSRSLSPYSQHLLRPLKTTNRNDKMDSRNGLYATSQSITLYHLIIYIASSCFVLSFMMHKQKKFLVVIWESLQTLNGTDLYFHSIIQSTRQEEAITKIQSHYYRNVRAFFLVHRWIKENQMLYGK